MGSVLEIFTRRDRDAAWHGGCLALAELGKYINENSEIRFKLVILVLAFKSFNYLSYDKRNHVK